ncbi:MAG: lipopolysaccharide biosynthesis protein [Deltaproteobacteria bacterium]|nr:lipopolysaccharide biosynthesis protein [Deltaproteobacteria bacterium]
MRETSSDATAREAARGVLVITSAKVWFLLTGFAQPLVLTRLLHTDGYGLYGVVLNVLSIVNNAVVAGSIQAMSRAVTERGPGALRQGLLLHGALGVLLAGGLAAGSVALGEGLLGDPQLPPLLRLGALVVGNYCVYAALVGAFNGRRRFVTQAGLDITFATLRTALVLGLAASGLGVAGAVGGFTAASTVILLVALALTLREGRGAAPEEGALVTATRRLGFVEFSKSYAGFFLPVLVYQFVLNLVLQADLLVLKALGGRVMDPAGLNSQVGVYKAVQNFAFLPYQLLLSVTFVVFPLVSRATLEGDRETTRGFVRGALRFSALALGAMLSVLAGLPRGVLRLAYRPPIDEGYTALRALSVAQGAFALSVLGTTLVVASGRTRAATGLMAAMLTAVFAGDALALSALAPRLGVVYGTALGTLGGCLFGLLAVGLYVRSAFGGFVTAPTALRVLLATGVSAGLGACLPPLGKAATLGASAALVVVYLAALALTRELGPTELATVKRLLGRRSATRGG